MRTPSVLWFVEVKRVLAYMAPQAGGARHWKTVLEVGWHRSPQTGPFSADMQAPVVQQQEAAARTAIHRFLPIQYVLPLACVMRQLSPGVLVALRRTWQPLSAVGAQPSWPKMMHYNI
jgi:hypothetical protein